MCVHFAVVNMLFSVAGVWGMPGISAFFMLSDMGGRGQVLPLPCFQLPDIYILQLLNNLHSPPPPPYTHTISVGKIYVLNLGSSFSPFLCACMCVT